MTRTNHDKILLAQSATIDSVRLNQLLTELERACAAYDEAAQRLLLRELVPEMNENTSEKVPGQAEAVLPDNVITLNKYNA